MRRRSTAVVVVLALALLAPPPAMATPHWRPRAAAAVDFARQRSGSVSFAIYDTRGDIFRYDAGRDVPAASVLKVMFMVAYLRQPSVRDRALKDSDRRLLYPMIVRSANEPATVIANRLGPGPMNRLAQRAHMLDFAYRRPWGMTTTSARDQARFLNGLRYHLPDRHERYAMHLLRSITDSQRWGIGQVPSSGWAKHFKGGWGSGSGAVDHQVVRLESDDGKKITIAVMTTNSPNHDYAKATLRGVFARLLRDLPAG